MRKRMGRWWIAFLAGVVTSGPGAAWTVRAQVAVVNQGFESPALAQGGFTQAIPPGWSLVSGSVSSTGVFHPTIPSWGYRAPSGNQVLYLNGATVEQQLAANVIEGEPCLLAVDVVRRPGFWNPNYRIDFYAGNVLLGSDLGTLVPADGGSLVSLIGYTAGPGDPAIGQPLKVRLGGPTQTNFDDVRVLVPEPGVEAPLQVVGALVLLARRRIPRVRSARA